MNEQNNSLISNNGNTLGNVGVIPSVPIITPEMVQPRLNNVNNNNVSLNQNSVQVQKLDNNNSVVENLNEDVLKENNITNNLNDINSFQNSNFETSNQIVNNTPVVNDELGLDALYVPNSNEKIANVNNLEVNVSNQSNDLLNINQEVANSVPDVNNLSSVLQNNIQNQNIQHNISNNFNALNDNILNNELERAYVGEKYDKIKNNSFSLPGFFFGISYLLYRKMYLYAFLTFLVCFTPLALVAYIFLGIFINKWYLKFVNKKVNKIKSENSNKTNDELKAICSKKGGTSVGAVILGTLLSFGIVIVLMLILIISVPSVLGNINVAKDKLDENINGNSDVINSFDGSFMYDFVRIKDVFEIEIPYNFEDDSSSNIYKYNYFNESGSIFGDCSITLSAVAGYSSSKELSNQMATYYGVKNVLENTFNGIKWYNFVDKSSFETTYYYLTDSDGKVYLYNFSIYKDLVEICEPYHNSIINSVKFK